MQWQGTSRTNYVKIEDVKGLREALEPFGMELEEHTDEPGYYAIEVQDYDHGGVKKWAIDDAGDELEFSFEEHVMPYVAEGEVLVVMEAGSEGQRYISGYAEAYQRQNDEVRSVTVSLSSIYQLAAEAFSVSEKDIASCSYQLLPESLEEQRRSEQLRSRERG